MNAYELADELDALFTKADWEEIPNVVAILRQQADRIAELEKDGKVCATCGGLVYDPVIKQTKPLSDEEIRKIAIQCDAYDNDGSLITDDICIDKFARAIEERHGIK